MGCLLELCWKGTREVKLGESGEVRKFLKVGLIGLTDVLQAARCLHFAMPRKYCFR